MQEIRDVILDSGSVDEIKYQSSTVVCSLRTVRHWCKQNDCRKRKLQTSETAQSHSQFYSEFA